MERVVKHDKQKGESVLTTTRGGINTMLLRYNFVHPVICKLDLYIKESCLHRAAPRAGTLCGNCTTCNKCFASLAANHGGVIKFTPSPVNAARQTERERIFKEKRRRRDSLRANQRNIRYHKRAVARGSK